MNFRGQTVIVTGAGRGIGRVVASFYASRGANVVLADLSGEDGSAAERGIIDSGGRAAFVPVDVRIPEQVKQLMQEAVRLFGTLNILINNAGIGIWKSPCELTVEEWDSVVNTNLRGTFLCSREAVPIMRMGGGGAIVNIASTRALMSEPGGEAYAASKGGILSLTHALAISLSPDKIRVNAVSPGWIETGDYGGLREIDHLQHPAGRVGRPEDIARACLFLTDPENGFITGTNLVVDGGMTRKMIYEL